MRAVYRQEMGAWLTQVSQDFWLFLGVCLWALGMASLVTFDPWDGCAHVVSQQPIHNFCGVWGAWLVDWGYQWLGLGVWGAPWAVCALLWRYSRQHSLWRMLPGLFLWMTGWMLAPYWIPERWKCALCLWLRGEYLLWDWGIFPGFLNQKGPQFLWASLWFMGVVFWGMYGWWSVLPKKWGLFPVMPRASKDKLQGQHQGKTRQKRGKEREEVGVHVALSTNALPHLGLLKDYSAGKIDRRKELYLDQLQSILEDFGVKGTVLRANPGPIVTLYELEPAAGVKSSRVISLADDIARSMSALSARVAVISGKNLIGIELSNVHREMVCLKELLASSAYHQSVGDLPLVLGKDIAGAPVVVDLTKMPHLLVAGTTGSGKSVGINSMILSLLYRLSPQACKLIMIDPKMLELSVYDDIPHLLTPVITEPKKAIMALKWAVQEMENRYRLMARLGVRNIAGYNQRMREAWSDPCAVTRSVHVGFDDHHRPVTADQDLQAHPLPFIVVVVDEMADLMLVAGKELEILVQRLAQMARAAGIHLIMATQRPSVDVITGTIKANFPTRISFQVTSKIDSRTILGEQGAEHLLGQGDMLYMASGGRIVRVHGPFVSDQEIENVVHFLKSCGQPEYIDLSVRDDEWVGGGEVDSGEEELYRQAVDIMRRDRKISISYLQRQMQIGYNRAARLMEQMEQRSVVTPPNSLGKRHLVE